MADLFYAVPHMDMLNALKTNIQENGLHAFERTASTSVGNFMTLLGFYLCSRFVTYNGQVYI